MEFEAIKYLAQLGSTAILGVILGTILSWQLKNYSKEKLASEKRYESLLKADQATREEQTKALVNMYSTIDSLKDYSFNVQNICAVNRKECGEIREGLTVEVTRLQELNEKKT